MDYLALCNKVIVESACEADELTVDTWDADVSKRRIYPRIKRNVAEAWKQIQMDRGEWEFKTALMNTLIYPRVQIQDGMRAAGTPPVGTVFKADDDSFTFTVRAVYTTGDWTAGTATGQLEFEVYEGFRPAIGVGYTEVSPVAHDGTFIYIGKGYYTFLEIDPNLREPEWTTFTAFLSNTSNNQVVYIPWDNWLYTELEFTQGSQSTPLYVSQDYEGRVVFYPQTLQVWRASFVYDQAPSTLSAHDDVPGTLQEEYHDWIAWRALGAFALFDKNPDLYSYAQKNEMFYATRAERNLLPIPSWQRSAFNE